MFLRAFIFFSLAIISAKAEVKEDDHVAVLTKDNFSTVIGQYKYALVKFYAEWCGHCKALKPHYSKAAETLKSELPDLIVAKVDAVAESELASQHGVKGYPTLKFHKNGQWFDYDGGRDTPAIIKWVKRKVGPAVRSFNTGDEVDAFIKSDMAVVAFIKGSQSELEDIFTKVADSVDKAEFGLVKSPDIFKKFNVNGDALIRVYKSFDGPYTDYDGELTVEKITEFIKIESFPLIVEFSEDSANEVFRSSVKHHVVAFIPKSGQYKELMDKMRPTAKAHKGKVHFVVIDTDVEDHQRILEFFGMTLADVPAYRLVYVDEDMTKYKPDESDFSTTYMSAFIKEVLDGTRKPFLMSQEIPPESNDPVRVLVGKNYHEVTKDESKAVFVKLYAPWCGHCKQLAPIWDSLGEAFKDRDDIIIAKYDATANEAEGLRVEGFPTIKYYPKGSQEVIDYTGHRSLDALKKFVESDGKVVVPDKESDEEKETGEEKETDEEKESADKKPTKEEL